MDLRLIRKCILSAGTLKLIFFTALALLLLNSLFYAHLLRVTYGENKHISSVETDIGIKKKYTLFGRHVEDGLLHHVEEVLESMGYQNTSLDGDWTIMWCHDYPFKKLKSQMMSLKPYQLVNHFPGSGYITNKVNLATSGLPFVPKAFKLPDQKTELLEYIEKNPDKMFVLKSNNHRGIRIRKIAETDLSTAGTFIQEFIDRPMLVDGYKFDIGIYVIITSIDPMRVYVHEGEVLFRFCPEPYEPFDPDNTNKYVVHDDYRPIWKVPSLAKYYSELGFGMKASFEAYVKSQGKDPSQIWQQAYEAIRAVLLSKESSLITATRAYPSKRNFFELMRFDFALDEDLRLYIMEANMSPNLSSEHFPPNRLLYLQVLYSTLSLVGVGRRIKLDNPENELLQKPWKVEAAFKDIATFPEVCAKCKSCEEQRCKLCKTCLKETKGLQESLYLAHREHTDRHFCKRIVPPHLTPNEAVSGYEGISGLTEINQLMHEWFRGKCLLDGSWC